MTPRIVLFATESSPIDVEALRTGLRQDARFVWAPADCLRKPLDETAEACLRRAVADAHAIVFRVGQVPRAVIEAAAHLKIIAVHGVGTDSVALEAATRQKVYVTISPGTNADAVAEYVLGMLLMAARRLHESVARLRIESWKAAQLPGRELAGQRLGVVGFGAVGSRVARLGKLVGMHVAVSEYTGLANCPYSRSPLKELASTVDFLVVCVPLRPATVGLISDEILRNMPPHAVLVNVSRGGVVDEPALQKALDDDALAGAVLDVFSQEPAGPDHPLISHERVLATPHLAGATQESLARTAQLCGREIGRVLSGRPPRHAVNSF